MSTTLAIALLWTGFAATHLLLTNLHVRPRSIARLGEEGHRAFFSIVAAAFALPNLALAITGRSEAPLLWSFASASPAALPLYAGMAFAVVLMVLALVHRAPTFMAPGAAEVRGVLRITRHPLMMGIALFGISFLLWSGRSTDVAFFGGLAAFAIVGPLHQDYRYLRGPRGDRYRAFHEATSFLPFGRSPGQRREAGDRALPRSVAP